MNKYYDNKKFQGSLAEDEEFLTSHEKTSFDAFHASQYYIK